MSHSCKLNTLDTCEKQALSINPSITTSEKRSLSTIKSSSYKINMLKQQYFLFLLFTILSTVFIC